MAAAVRVLAYSHVHVHARRCAHQRGVSCMAFAGSEGLAMVLPHVYLLPDVTTTSKSACMWLAGSGGLAMLVPAASAGLGATASGDLGGPRGSGQATAATVMAATTGAPPAIASQQAKQHMATAPASAVSAQQAAERLSQQHAQLVRQSQQMTHAQTQRLTQLRQQFNMPRAATGAAATLPAGAVAMLPPAASMPASIVNIRPLTHQLILVSLVKVLVHSICLVCKLRADKNDQV